MSRPPRRTVVALTTTAGLCLASFAAANPAGAADAGAADRAAAAAPRLDGYTPASSAAQRAAEKTFMTYPSTSLARDLDKQLSAHTAMVGTPGAKQRMEEIVARLRSFGLTPKVDTYYVYMSSPRRISVTLTSPVRQQLPVKEKCRWMEPDCANTVVGYNALSPAGRVKAPVVYVNYGTTTDYATLAKAGISVKGKVVLARYGKVFRGVKTNLAAEHGAKGVILYSDPADDGFTRGPVYPNGPWRAADGIQRGSIQQLWQYSGDPTTPGYASTKDAPRIDPKHSNIAKIPTTPISYGAAKPILQHLGGAAAPKEWQGGLPLTYRLGSGSRVDLDLDITYSVKPVYAITASIKGAAHPEEVVQLGAHHDAWAYGSDDNLSGTEGVLQIARGLNKLMATGWRPARTIELGTWDGEEYGLFGSTEYAEAAGSSRLGKVVAYLNMDGAGGQSFGASSLPSFDAVIRDVARQVPWPGTSGTAYDQWAQAQGQRVPTPGRLGSGSDYTAFLDHFGVPAADVGSGTSSGDYHCSCDNFYMESHFIDPTWRYHVATAQVMGLLTMRLADADVIPLHYAGYGTEVVGYLNGLSAQQDTVFGRQLVDLDQARAAAAAWSSAAASLQKRIDARLDAGETGPQLDAITRRLELVERQLLVERGLPGRPWYKHQIYAAGVNSGYGTQVLPGVNDALFLRADVKEARQYAASLTASLRQAAQTLRG